MQGEAEGVQLLAEFGRVVVEGLRVFVEVAEAFLVFVKSQVQVAGLEGFVAEFFYVGYYLDDLGALELFGLVFGIVFVGVAGCVYGFG